MTVWDDIGGGLSDIEQGVESAVSDSIDVIKSIPGLGDAIGLAEDFANTDVGKAFFRVVSPMLMPTLWVVPFVGPALAASAYAFPGLARGDTLGQSIAEESKYQAERLEHAIGAAAGDEMAADLKTGTDAIEQDARNLADKVAGQAVSDVQDAVNKLGAQFGLTVPVDIDALASQYAAKLGIREDSARVIIDGVLGSTVGADALKNYDEYTGLNIPLRDAREAAARLAQQRADYAAYLKAHPAQQVFYASEVAPPVSDLSAIKGVVLSLSPPAPPPPPPPPPPPVDPMKDPAMASLLVVLKVKYVDTFHKFPTTEELLNIHNLAHDIVAASPTALDDLRGQPLDPVLTSAIQQKADALGQKVAAFHDARAADARFRQVGQTYNVPPSMVLGLEVLGLLP